MGLDMYLNRFSKNDDFEDYSIYGEEIGYWRKANAIHEWFVKNCQNGKDDCERYIVSQEQLAVLRDTCKKISDILTAPGIFISETSEKKITGYCNGGPIYTPIRSFPREVVEQIDELLPTASGFFFGSTDYDEGYLEDIKETVGTLEKVLKTTDFDQQIITYRSSW